MKLLPVDLDTTSSDGGLFQQYVGGTADVSDPLVTVTSTGAPTLVRDLFRVAVMVTNDPANTGAHIAIAAGWQGIRFRAERCRIVAHSVTFSETDGLMVSVTFKFPPMDVAGTERLYEWGSATTAELAALGSYT